MDSDDRLTEELGEELRRSLAEMRLHPEFRQELKGRLLATPVSRWRRWLGAWPVLARHPGALAGIAVAAIVVGVAIPLAAALHSPASSGRSYLVIISPELGAGGSKAAAAAPAICAGGTVHLSVSPTQATLAPGQSAQFQAAESGSACALSATVTGPSAAGLSIKQRPASSSNASGVARTVYQVSWTGRPYAAGKGTALTAPSGSRETGRLSPGTYKVTLSVPTTTATANIVITIKG
ncbi:MAG TPA: hypothetical protein VNH38_00615 [Candidatus Dormibacteraeota bacterium]|nr:hypothetical protein [Candidatus Dormibacteraeota bacterium]